MVMETVEKIMGNLGAADIDARLEEQLIDGILYAFQEQTTEDVVMLNGFGTIVNALSKRVKPYLPQICGTILWRLNNKSAKVRQQAADLISRIAAVMKTCQEEKLMGHLGVVLYEYLGEEYPEVLGSILGALKAIVNVIGMHKMTPPIKDLLPRLTPILKVSSIHSLPIDGRQKAVNNILENLFLRNILNQLCWFITESPRKSTRKLHRLGGPNRRSRSGVRVGARVDAHLF